MALEAVDLVVIGAGPGGYVAAKRAGQVVVKTAIIEREWIGGVCLNVGCIPSKALIHNAEVLELFHRAKEFGVRTGEVTADFGAAVDRAKKIVRRLTKGVEGLLKKAKVEIVMGTARLEGPRRVVIAGTDGKSRELAARAIVIATGSRVRELPAIPIDGRTVISSNEALWLNPLPESLAIVGAGAVGMEFAYVFSTYGVKVTVIELLPRVLALEDAEVSAEVARQFDKSGIVVHTGTKVTSGKPEGVGLRLELSGPKGLQTLDVEKVLVAGGRQPNVENMGLENLGVKIERGAVAVGEDLQTNVEGVYAIGDVTGRLPLAHVASAEGVWVAEHLAGKNPSALDYDAMPRCTYCRPQVASVGLTEEQARERGLNIKIGRFPFQANGKALALGEGEGFVKIVAGAEHGEILGAHLVGPDVTELLPEFILAKNVEATVDEIRRSVHAHPTLSETVMEAAAAALGHAIHI